MATVTHRVATTSSVDTSTYTSGSFTPTAGDLLIAFAVVSATTDPGAMTASANGITFTKITTKASGTATIYAFIADLFVPSSPTAMTVTMDVIGDAGTGCIIVVASAAGMGSAGTTAVRQSKTGGAPSGTTPQLVFDSTPLTANPQLGVIVNATTTGGANVNPPASWTEGADVDHANPNRGLEYAYRASGGTTATITWGSSSATSWDGILVELSTSTSATVTPPTVTVTADVAAPALSTGSTVTATVVSRPAAIPPPTLSTGSIITPPTISGAAGVGTPSLSTAATITPPTVAAVASVGMPSLVTATSTTVPVVTVAAAANITAPALSTGTRATPATVVASAAVPVPVITRGATATPPTVAAAASVGAIPSTGITVAVATVEAAADVPAPPLIGMSRVDISFDADPTRTSTVTATVTRASTTDIDPDTRSNTIQVDDDTRSSTVGVANNRSATIQIDNTRSSTVTIGEARQERGA